MRLCTLGGRSLLKTPDHEPMTDLLTVFLGSSRRPPKRMTWPSSWAIVATSESGLQLCTSYRDHHALIFASLFVVAIVFRMVYIQPSRPFCSVATPIWKNLAQLFGFVGEDLNLDAVVIHAHVVAYAAEKQFCSGWGSVVGIWEVLSGGQDHPCL